jgi:hypothetical protein
LDGQADGAWVTVDSSVKSFTPAVDLTEATHTLYVQARNSVGNWGPSGSKATTIMTGLFGDAIYVSTSTGSDANDGTLALPKKTIQAGIAVAVANGVNLVKVALGTYVEDVTVTAGVSLYGGYSADFSNRNINSNVTTINAPAVDRIVNAQTSNAAIFINTTSDLTIQGFTVSANISLNKSYGIYILGNSATISVDSCIVDGGNGSFSYAIYSVTGTPIISNCRISSNNGSTNSFGTFRCKKLTNCIIDGIGGVGVTNALRISDCIVKNTGSYGIHLPDISWGYNSDSLVVHSCSLFTSGGGSAILSAQYSTDIVIDSSYFSGGNAIGDYDCRSAHVWDCVFENAGINIAWADDLQFKNCSITNGSGLRFLASAGTVENCTIKPAANSTGIIAETRLFIKNNLIVVSGTGSGVEIIANGWGVGPSIINNTIINLSNNGYGIKASPVLNISRIVNNIIAGFATGVHEYSNIDPLAFRNNLIFNCPVAYHDNDLNADLTTQADLNDYTKTTQHVLRYSDSNIIADPLFTNAAGGDYTLQAGSPAVNAGRDVSGADDGAVTTDFLGVSRPQGAGYDIGAFESH